MTEDVKPKKIEADPDAFCSAAALAAPLKKSRMLWSYATEVHTKLDVLKPGYFRTVANFGIRHLDIIECELGDGIEAKHMVLKVDWPNSQGPLYVARRDIHGNYTPVRHDGGAIEEAA